MGIFVVHLGFLLFCFLFCLWVGFFVGFFEGFWFFFLISAKEKVKLASVLSATVKKKDQKNTTSIVLEMFSPLFLNLKRNRSFLVCKAL